MSFIDDIKKSDRKMFEKIEADCNTIQQLLDICDEAGAIKLLTRTLSKGLTPDQYEDLEDTWVEYVQDYIYKKLKSCDKNDLTFYVNFVKGMCEKNQKLFSKRIKSIQKENK